MDRLAPAGVLILHYGTCVRQPRERSGRDVAAVPLPRLRFGETDTCDLWFGVDRAGDGAVANDSVVTAGILRGHLALTEGGVGQLPVACAVADGVDVRDRRTPPRAGGDAGPPVELDPDSLETEPVDDGPAAGRDEHQVRHDGLAVTEVDGQLRSGVLDLGALSAQTQRDAAPAELFRQLVRNVCVLPW